MKFNSRLGLLVVLLLSNFIFESKGQVGCPSVSAGPDVSVSCNNPCVNLTATWFDSGQTNNYLDTDSQLMESLASWNMIP